MKENGDTAIFDIKRSRITETRSYLKNNQLIYLHGDDITGRSPEDLRRKQDDLKAGFEKYLHLVATN